MAELVKISSMVSSANATLVTLELSVNQVYKQMFLI